MIQQNLDYRKIWGEGWPLKWHWLVKKFIDSNVHFLHCLPLQSDGSAQILGIGVYERPSLALASEFVKVLLTQSKIIASSVSKSYHTTFCFLSISSSMPWQFFLPKPESKPDQKITSGKTRIGQLVPRAEVPGIRAPAY